MATNEIKGATIVPEPAEEDSSGDPKTEGLKDEVTVPISTLSTRLMADTDAEDNDNAVRENSHISDLDECDGRPLSVVHTEDPSIASSVTSAFHNADLFATSIYPCTQHLLEDAADPHMTEFAKIGLQPVLEESQGKDSGTSRVMDDEQLRVEKKLLSGGLSAAKPEPTSSFADEDKESQSEKSQQYAQRALPDASTSLEQKFKMEATQPVPDPSALPIGSLEGQPGAHAVDGPESSVLPCSTTAVPGTEALPNQIDPEQGRLVGLAEAKPVVEEEQHAPQAVPMVERKKPFTVQNIILVAVVGFVVLGGILAGAICGSGLCSNHKNEATADSSSLAPFGDAETLAPTTYNRNTTEAADIEWSIKYVLGIDYFERTDRFIQQARQQALHWILYEDPLQLGASTLDRLIQRYLLVLFYFQTTKETPWLECNPSSDGGSSLCYHPDAPSVHHPDSSTIWGSRWLSESNECKWAGVECSITENDQRDVISKIQLSHNQLNGPLPWELSELSHLRGLKLDYNNLTGTVPFQLGNLDSSLESLSLSTNKLHGTIPALLFGTGHNTTVPSLLRLSNNFLTGTIPPHIFGRKLLDLGNNLLSGSLPMDLFRSTNLAYLFLNGNTDITGTVPTQIAQLTRIKYLFLEDTSLSGSIPTEVALLSNMEELKLSNLNMEGTIPEELFHGIAQSMSVIEWDGCAFSGTISTAIGLLTKLISFNVANNKFSGTIPDVFGALSDLYTTSFNGNNFTPGATIPQSLCAQRNTLAEWQVVADCLPDDATGVPLMECPASCCTTCCDPTTDICRST